MNAATVLLIATALGVAPLTANVEGISYTTTRGNIYSAGRGVDVTENASNDIVAAGGNVIISGDAGNEVFAAGGTVLLSGKTGGDARIAGGNITVDNEIGGEAVIGGGRIRMLPRSAVKGDLFAASGDIRLDGAVEGDARMAGGQIFINGTVKKDVYIKADKLVIGKNALISGDLHYEAPEEAVIEQGAVIKGLKEFTKKQPAPHRMKSRKFLWTWRAVKLSALLAAALAIYFVARKKTQEFAAYALKWSGRELLTGFLVLVAVPPAVLLLALTIAGSLLGLLGLFFYLAFIALSWVLGAVVFGALAGRYIIKKEPLTWPVVLLGVFLYQAAGLIPLLGWIVKFAFFLLALGTLSHLAYLRLRLKEPAPPTA